jgi:hypothetical protein
MKKICLWFFIMTISLLIVTGCKTGGATKNGTGYGITHENYVGLAKMTVSSDKVDSVTFDEVYLPSDWAKITTSTTIPEDIVAVGNAWFGKFLVIGDKHFTGTARTDMTNIPSKQTVIYAAEGITDLYVWLRSSEANCKWYADTVIAGNAFVAKADWTKSSLPSAGPSGWTKSTSNYWPKTDTSMGWSGNIAKVSAALKGTRMDAENNLTLVAGQGWTVNGTQSGATLEDFPDYYTVARRAYVNATSSNA